MKITELIVVNAINMSDGTQKVTFSDIYNDDYNRCLAMVFLAMWDLENGKNCYELFITML